VRQISGRQPREVSQAVLLQLLKAVKDELEKRKHEREEKLEPGNENQDRKFARLAIEEARKSVPENDDRPHPLVGAVVVKDGKVLATAYRGEAEGNHAEYITLEKKLDDAALVGATVYTTLEPCTTQNHPKIPCADRLIERKVARVVIGMLDPNPNITGAASVRLAPNIASGLVRAFEGVLANR